VGKPERNRPLGGPRCGWDDGVRVDCKEIGWESVDWTNPAWKRDKWQAVVKAAMNCWVP
jgi:hypothetical protein